MGMIAESPPVFEIPVNLDMESGGNPTSGLERVSRVRSTSVPREV